MVSPRRRIAVVGVSGGFSEGMFRDTFVMSWGDFIDHPGSEEPSGSMICAKPLKDSPTVLPTLEHIEGIIMTQYASVRDANWLAIPGNGKCDNE
jgi:hypothetical protein